MRLYQERPRATQVTSFVLDMHLRLEQWFEQLPPPLRLDTANLPQHCPPPHIFAAKYVARRTHRRS